MRKLTEEHKRKIGLANSIALKGKKRPRAVIEKIRATHLKFKFNWKGGKPKCLDCGKEVSYAAKICVQCLGKRQRSENNPFWKGTQAKYTAIHMWLYSNFGKPKICEICGKKRKMMHWANISGLYKRIRSDWMRLCVPCHKRYDLNRLKGQTNED